MWIFAKIGAYLAGKAAFIIGVPLVAAAIYGGGYLHGQINSKNAAEVRQLEATVEYLREEMARREARTQADNEARQRDDAELDRFDETTEEATNDPQGTDDLDEPLLDERITRRLRELWRD